MAHYSHAPYSSRPSTQPYTAYAPGQVGFSQHYQPSNPPVAHYASAPNSSRAPTRRPSFTPEDDTATRHTHLTHASSGIPRAPQPTAVVAPGTFALVGLDAAWLRERFRADRPTSEAFATRRFLVLVHDALGAEVSFMFVWTHPPGRSETHLALPLAPMPHHRVRINDQDYRTVSVPGFPHPTHQCIWTSPPIKAVAIALSPYANPVTLGGGQVAAVRNYATTDLHAQGLQWKEKYGSGLPSADTGYVDDARVSIFTDLRAAHLSDPNELLRLLIARTS